MKNDENWSVVILPLNFNDLDLVYDIANKYNCEWKYNKTQQVKRIKFFR